MRTGGYYPVRPPGVVQSFERLAVEQGIFGADDEVANQAATVARSALSEVRRLDGVLERISITVTDTVRAHMFRLFLGAWPIVALAVLAVIALGVVLLRLTQGGPGTGEDLGTVVLALLGGVGLWGAHAQSRGLTTALGPMRPPDASPSTDTATVVAPVAPSAGDQSLLTSLAARLG